MNEPDPVALWMFSQEPVVKLLRRCTITGVDPSTTQDKVKFSSVNADAVMIGWGTVGRTFSIVIEST
jgi:hypothetical protein